MKLKGTTASLALLLSGALLLGACTSDAGVETAEDSKSPAEQQQESTAENTEATAEEGGVEVSGDIAACAQKVDVTAPKDGQVVFTAGPGSWDGYNNLTSRTYSTYNSVIVDQMIGGFIYYGVDGTICRNEEFGTFEVLSEDPLKVQYTISDKAVWSDGTPVTINDFLLDYASQNPEWLVPGYISGENPDAKPLFDSVSTSLPEQVPNGPQGEVGSKTFTLEYANTYPDYQLLVGGAFPSHVVAKQSGLEPEALAQAILDQKADVVTKAAEFWNNGWIFNPGELPDASLVPSSSHYKIKQGGWDDTSLTLEANDKYWGTPAATKNLVFRFIDDAAMAQALQNGDVNAITPQATVDTLGQLEAIGPAVKVETYSTFTWEHFDFNFAEGSVFADSKGGLTLREAFALCAPRQAIVDTLIKPVAADSVMMNGREVFPFQGERYETVVSAAYDGRYDQVDIEAAKAKIAESGLSTPIDVRVGYRSGNQRRTETVALLKASCDQAGFNIIDSNAEDFFSNALVKGDYDIALFAWAGSGQIASGQNIYSTDRPQNFGKFSNAKVDEAWEKLAATLDKDEQLEQIKVIEKELWDNLFGLPLFPYPGVSAYSADLQNVRPTAAQSQLSWNAYQWVAQ